MSTSIKYVASFTEEVNKVALSAEDDKRVIRTDGVRTFAIGHYRDHK